MKTEKSHVPVWLLSVLLLLSGCDQARSEREPPVDEGEMAPQVRWLKRATNATNQVDDWLHGSPRQAPRGAKPELIVENNRITLDGKLLVLEAPVAEWWAVLGPPSRQDRLGSIQVWDNLGIGVTTNAESYEEQLITDMTRQFNASGPKPDDAYERERHKWKQTLDQAKKSGVFEVSSLFVNIRSVPGRDTDDDGKPVLRNAFKGYLQVNDIGVDADSTLRDVFRWSDKSKHPLSYHCLRLNELRRCTANTEVVENGPSMDFGFRVDETEQRRVMSFSFSCEDCPRPAP
ncbi:hypothetical protein [Burkholderia cepacia]|uniref:DUF7738 domain-containing protein n=1 Tax=Burkholderia cepacia TaxID=292 RepID=UPI003B587F7C